MATRFQARDPKVLLKVPKVPAEVYSLDYIQALNEESNGFAQSVFYFLYQAPCSLA